MPAASDNVEKYFSSIESNLLKCYEVANLARSRGIDPENKVDIPLAKNMAERVEGLISAVKPEIIKSGLAKRIEELEKKYGALSLPVAMVISYEVSEGKFCKFKDKKDAMEVGVRTGFAYLTIGVVSAPLEGFTELKIKKTKDGKEYLSTFFSGPVRGAGGTAMAFFLVVVDYVRKMHGYAPYDATEDELSRAAVELDDYHERVTNLQYRPSPEEIKFLVSHCPIEVDGDPTERLEVSQFKDLPRIETNRIRGGVCLVLSMLALKSPKLFKETKKLKAFGISWDFIDEFLKIQLKKKSKASKSTDKRISPDFTFISDLVAGRPVLTYPLQNGGLRLRYGHTRVSGYSAAGMNPATLIVLDKYIATGTQLKVERPGKAAAITPCDTIEGPIVKLFDGSVLRFDTEVQAKAYPKEVQEILYLGDILISYGDFFDRNHPLVPAGYCDEWYKAELDTKSAPIPQTVDEAIKTAREIAVPLSPQYTYYWNAISSENVKDILKYLQYSNIKEGRLVLPIKEQKRFLELIGLPHKVVSQEFVVISEDDSTALIASLGLKDDLSNIVEQINKTQTQSESALTLINKLSDLLIRDKCGTFIGARMGRPEKAKMRKLIGSPHVLFPVGDEGGRLRSFQSALEKGKVSSKFPTYYCDSCKVDTIYKICERCSSKSTTLYSCKECTSKTGCEHSPNSFKIQSIDIKHYFDASCKQIPDTVYPDLIKGVRGTSNKDHIPEHLAKGILRAKNGIGVNKDGTVRYDMSELPITHFRCDEIGVSIEVIKSLGYVNDKNGKPISSPDQVIEILPQDIILPSSIDAVEDSADAVLLRTAAFVDEELEYLYKVPRHYNFKSRKDLVGQLVIGLAPHISAGIVGRIVGFSKTLSLLAHPLYHAAMRRDADGDEACVILVMDALLNFSRQYLPDSRGAKTMDSPLVLTPRLIPAEVDDMAHRYDIHGPYPLEFYEAAQKYASPSEVKIKLLGSTLGTFAQYEGIKYTHELSSINAGVLCSAYKTLPSMEEKLRGQMILADKIRAVDAQDVARLVIEKHLLKDIRGNLRKFSNQQFRCVKCNKKFRRPMLIGSCDACGGKLLFTVSEGTIVKYMEPAISLAEKYVVSPYLLQVLDQTRSRIADIFGKEKDRQEGLGKWFG